MPDLSKISELDPAELQGIDVKDIKCRACSGYGNCGYRSYRIYEGKPVLLCLSRRDQLLAERAAQSEA